MAFYYGFRSLDILGRLGSYENIYKNAVQRYQILCFRLV